MWTEPKTVKKRRAKFRAALWFAFSRKRLLLQFTAALQSSHVPNVAALLKDYSQWHHAERRSFELLNEVIPKQSVLELVNICSVLVGDVFESSPHQQRAVDVIALDASFAALPRFDARELFDLAVILLNLPAHGTLLSGALGRRLRGVVCHDVIRAEEDTGTRNSCTFESLGKP